jgi:acetyl-CoA acyltransferase 2
VRTAFGKFGGSLKDISATDLAVPAAKAALERAGVAPDDVDHVVFGNVLQTSADAVYLARHVGLKAGVPIQVPALTLNRLCGSGFQAIVYAAEQILTGQSQCVLTGGTESMSMAPHAMWGARWGLPLGKTGMVDLLWECLTDSNTKMSMAQTAEKLGEKYELSRVDVDQVAVDSQTRWAAANAAGKFKDEIVPVILKSKKGDVSFEVDEHPRATDAAALAKLPPYFKKDGLVTAGNASGSATVRRAWSSPTPRGPRRRGSIRSQRLVGWGITGCDPTIMGIGPAPASRRAFEQTGLGLGDMALVEVNEAFAPQYLAVERELGLDRSITNVNGGAIALGHPLGASGARITSTLIHELRRRKQKYGLGSACIGGGQGIAVIVEAL